MSPEQLTELLTYLRSAADVVEAIDSPELQRQHGWDLAGWHYEPVPWGVRFLFRDPRAGGEAEVVALVTQVLGLDRGRDPEQRTRGRTVVLFGSR